MQLKHKFILPAAIALFCASSVWADEPSSAQPAESSLFQRAASSAQAAVSSTSSGINAMVEKSMSFLGIRYRYGGNGPEAGGFDCSGLVKKVFGEALGVNLPRTAVEMARLGDKVNGVQDLKPGDLVFFNTMRRAFSHVGIYVGDNRFIHAPSTGNVVRVEDMDSDYWRSRFNGARRLVSDAQAADLPQSVRDAAAARINANAASAGAAANNNPSPSANQ
ncbi:C40 family peptidase [Uliginosibacterium gangwonense]|uniref:C40 family peptidase n=1 Tax=Uliginosibacterium gangwonense TaxID=392736 RepID=UPI00035CDBAC|nr:C40 family peptidase [Uliginosibacterium gangwonense]